MNNKTALITQQFEDAFTAHKDSMYDYAIKIMKNSSEAEDIVHDSFMKFHDQLQKNIEIYNIKNWLFTVTRNLCLTTLNRKKKQAPFDEQTVIQESGGGASIEMTHFVEQALGHLDSKYREVLILRSYYEYSYEEIARIMQKSIPAVKSLLFKGRKKLHKLMQKTEKTRLQICGVKIFRK